MNDGLPIKQHLDPISGIIFRRHHDGSVTIHQSWLNSGVRLTAEAWAALQEAMAEREQE